MIQAATELECTSTSPLAQKDIWELASEKAFPIPTLPPMWAVRKMGMRDKTSKMAKELVLIGAKIYLLVCVNANSPLQKMKYVLMKDLVKTSF